MLIRRNESIDSFVTACSEPLPDIDDDALDCPGTDPLRTETNLQVYPDRTENSAYEQDWITRSHRYGWPHCMHL